MIALIGRQKEAFRELDPSSLMTLAREHTGLWDFGDEGFVESLTKLLNCVTQDANLHAVGLKDFKDEIVRNLVNKLRFERDVRKHPQILDEDVSDPIIVIGLPRSGTTKSHRMLACAPNQLSIQTWQLLNPAPFSDVIEGTPDARISVSDLLWTGADPNITAAHFFGVAQVEEDWGMYSYLFNDWFHYMRTPSRRWHDWVMAKRGRPHIENYTYVKQMYQYLQWQQGGRRNRRWLMKSCGQLDHLDELVKTFPKATMLHVHRDPTVCIPSFNKILFDIASLRVADLDPQMVGETVLEWARASLAQYMEARDRLGLADQIVDVQYQQIRDDPMPAFESLYDRAGLKLSADARDRMVQWELNNEQGKHGKHIYALEEFGLNQDLINRELGAYIHRFIKQSRRE